jgi:site-specific recombinase XerD
MNKQKPKLLTQLSEVIRLKHYSLKTEKSYIHWCRRFIIFHKKRHPKEMNTQEVQAFLNYLAVDQHVSASTQNQALNAIVFLYKNVIKKELGTIDAIRARRPKRLPVVLTREETRKILSLLSGVNHLMGSFLYGSGLRLMECLRLRIKEIDFSAKHIIVRDGKGFKDRVTVLPEKIIPELSQHLVRVRAFVETLNMVAKK